MQPNHGAQLPVRTHCSMSEKRLGVSRWRQRRLLMGGTIPSVDDTHANNTHWKQFCTQTQRPHQNKRRADTRTERIANISSGMVLWRFTMSDRAVVETMLVKASRSRQSQQAKSNQRSNRSDEGIMDCSTVSTAQSFAERVDTLVCLTTIPDHAASASRSYLPWKNTM